MSLVTEANSRRKRRVAPWELLLGIALLPPAGLFIWGWYEPVSLFCGDRGLVFGSQKGSTAITDDWPDTHSGVWFVCGTLGDQPGDGYAVGWKRRVRLPSPR